MRKVLYLYPKVSKFQLWFPSYFDQTFILDKINIFSLVLDTQHFYFSMEVCSLVTVYSLQFQVCGWWEKFAILLELYQNPHCYYIVFFSFCATLNFSLMNCPGLCWHSTGVLLEFFVKHKLWNYEECYSLLVCTYIGRSYTTTS